MPINYRVLGLAAIGVGALLAGGYALTERQALRAAPTPGNASAAPHPADDLHTAARALPAGHARVAGVSSSGAAAVEAQREGKVHPDPTQWFTHFRVGSKNVKSILADGSIVWVGTSGGVIRYDTSTDNYKLYDTRDGLLSNGVFHVGKL